MFPTFENLRLRPDSISEKKIQRSLMMFSMNYSGVECVIDSIYSSLTGSFIASSHSSLTHF
jgi:hypothetical protein